jgi:hypothetical protein
MSNQQISGQPNQLASAPFRREVNAILLAGSALALLHSPPALPAGVQSNRFTVVQVQTPRVNPSTAAGMPATLRANVPGPLPAGAAWTRSAPTAVWLGADTSRGSIPSAGSPPPAPFVNTLGCVVPRTLWQPAGTSQSAYAAQQFALPTFNAPWLGAQRPSTVVDTSRGTPATLLSMGTMPAGAATVTVLARGIWQPSDTSQSSPFSRFSLPVIVAPSAQRRIRQQQLHQPLLDPALEQRLKFIDYINDDEDDDDELLLM